MNSSPRHLLELSGQLYAPAALPPGTHWIGWVGHRAGLDAVVKRKTPSPRRESNPRILIGSKIVNIEIHTECV
jgi:hypothetical protein